MEPSIDQRPKQRPVEVLELMLEATPEPILILDGTGKILRANGASAELFGLDAQELAGRSFGHPIEGGQAVEIEIGIDPVRCVEMRAVQIDWGGAEATMAVLHDITEVRRMRRERQRVEAQFRSIFDAAPVGMAICSLEGELIDVNGELTRLVGRSRDDLRGSTLTGLLDAGCAERAREQRQRLSEGSQTEAGFECALRAGHSRIPIELRMRVAGEGEDRFVAVQIEDLSDRLQREAYLRHLADHDSLTGLANRGAFMRALEHRHAEATRYRTPAAVIVADLDGLKAVNDAHGHAAGDSMLAAAAHAMSSRLRASDLLARLGGDEFAAIAPQLSGEPGDERESLKIVAEALVVSVRDCWRPRATGGSAPLATASVGAAMLYDFPTGQQALNAADAAMYEVKGRGGDGFALAPETPVSD